MSKKTTPKTSTITVHAKSDIPLPLLAGMHDMVTACPRCGKIHANLPIFHITNPIVAGDTVYEYFSLCQTLNEPILISCPPSSFRTSSKPKKKKATAKK